MNNKPMEFGNSGKDQNCENPLMVLTHQGNEKEK